MRVSWPTYRQTEVGAATEQDGTATGIVKGYLYSDRIALAVVQSSDKLLTKPLADLTVLEDDVQPLVNELLKLEPRQNPKGGVSMSLVNWPEWFNIRTAVELLLGRR